MTEKKGERGPKFTPPSIFKVKRDADTNYSRWLRSMNSQLDYEKKVYEELDKFRNNKNYKPQIIISRKYKHLFT